ncbi:hypothetical protein [Bosea rubneri]|uniref:Uncharacterized protein n=1 Tax=Bosea rubneri TaxID=3075434 RepID=A0ABU3S4D9_9HYPH|nr:hypothetical protein [Bosea sp. ZW T0_25]MDU0339617.1 hypothetical protein [Bosea sp. ZW T0_25]
MSFAIRPSRHLWLCPAALAALTFGVILAAAQPLAPIACTGPFARNADEAALLRAFGKENVRRARIEVGEGEKQPGAIIFPGDSKRRIELIWQDGAKRRRPATIYIREGSGQSVEGPDGMRIAIGTPLAAVEKANGGPFTILGFGWDYAGTATDWRGGKLAKAGGGCRLLLRFHDTPGADGAALDRVSGDSEFSSGDADIKAVKPVVGEILLSWTE